MKSILVNTKRLSEIRTGKGIPFLTPEVSPGTHCPMRMASVISEEIKGLSSLLVGMPECTTYSRLFSLFPEGKEGELHWLYVLDSREVIFGCRDGVMEAIKKMDHEGAKAILVIATCIPELVGEDFESIIHEVRPEINASITSIMLGQFKNISYPSGAWKTMEAMAGLMLRESINKSQANILGRPPEEEHVPMPLIFKELENNGVKLRYLAPGASAEDFQSAADAVLNIVVSPYAYPLAVRMKKEFGTPFISLHDCYSPSSISDVYEEIEKIFNINMGEKLESEKERSLLLQHKAIELCKGKNYVMTLRVDLPLPLTEYFTKVLKMEPLLLHLEEYYPGDDRYVKKIIKEGCDPPVCRIVNEYSAFSKLKMLQPDLCIGYLPDVDETTVLIDNMFDLYGWIGYERTEELLKRIIAGLKTTDKGE